MEFVFVLLLVTAIWGFVERDRKQLEMVRHEHTRQMLALAESQLKTMKNLNKTLRKRRNRNKRSQFPQNKPDKREN